MELKIAKDLGTHRTPLSGGASRITRGDVIHETLYVEVKQRASFAVMGIFKAVRERARQESRTPVLLLHQSKSKNQLAVIDWKFFLELWKNFSGS